MPQKIIFDYEKFGHKIDELKNKYKNNYPYPHIVLENFLDKDSLEKAVDEFEAIEKSEAWINYVHFNENKKGLNGIDGLPENLRSVIKQLNGHDFVNFLGELSGIEDLMADDSCEGGGIHQSTKGGFLNIHADFTAHPHRRNWQRRVNVIVYLNKDWKDEWGGHLELWGSDMKSCEARVSPVFNRCVIFNTNSSSFHGHPEPMTCPAGFYRRSIALYFYTQEKHPYRRSTNYKARPNDGAKKILIALDNLMLAIYSRIKSLIGSNDKVMSYIFYVFQKINKLLFSSAGNGRNKT